MNAQIKPDVDALMEEAARWHARLDCGTADLGEFERWRNADPRHAAAFTRILGLLGQIDVLKPALRAKLAPVTRRAAWQMVAASAVATILGGASFLLLSGGRVSAETPVGGSLERVLDDGSRLRLNTDSKVQWLTDDQRRRVWLDRGEIALTVHEGSVPFVLESAGQVVIVRKGRINARIRNGTLDLLVLEGGADIRGDSNLEKHGQGTPVTAGQAVLATKAQFRVRAMTPDDIQFVSAWQNGEVYFNGETLSAAVDEYNRYLRHKILVGDPSLQGVRLGGRFDNRNPDAFLRSLHDAFSINAIYAPDGSVILTR